MDGIGPALPLHRDDKFGSYSLYTKYADQIKQNFKNLLLTAPGERMMSPAFGVGLRNFLFENRHTAVSAIRQRVESQVSRYMPFVKINKMHFNAGVAEETARDSNILSISIEYSVPSLNIAASLILNAGETN